MSHFKRYIFLFLAVLFSETARVCAQNGINSPYSRFGLGTLADRSTGFNKAMGGTGIGLRQTNTINLQNPASYSTVDTLTFLADFGMSLQYGHFKENGQSVNAKNSSIDYAIMQFRIFPKVGMTVGFMPFSNVGYSFSTTTAISRDEDGLISSTNKYTGTGGLHELVAGFGWRSFDRLFFGADAEYLFGDINYTVQNSYTSTNIFPRTKSYTAEIHALKINLGVQAQFDLEKGRLTAGATWSPQLGMNSETMVTDLIYSESTVQKADTLHIPNAFSLPQTLGVGIGYSTEKVTLCTDLSLQLWSGAKFFGEKSGSDRLVFSLGGSYLYDAESKNLFQRSSYKFGLSYKTPYANLDGGTKGAGELALSLGLSMPIVNNYNSRSKINISGQYVRVTPSRPGLVEESYMRLNIGIQFSERWFYKWRVE